MHLHREITGPSVPGGRVTADLNKGCEDKHNVIRKMGEGNRSVGVAAFGRQALQHVA